jgi:hypothetical protein
MLGNRNCSPKVKISPEQNSDVRFQTIFGLRGCRFNERCVDEQAGTEPSRSFGTSATWHFVRGIAVTNPNLSIVPDRTRVLADCFIWLKALPRVANLRLHPIAKSAGNDPKATRRGDRRAFREVRLQNPQSRKRSCDCDIARAPPHST